MAWRPRVLRNLSFFSFCEISRNSRGMSHDDCMLQDQRIIWGVLQEGPVLDFSESRARPAVPSMTMDGQGENLSESRASLRLGTSFHNPSNPTRNPGGMTAVYCRTRGSLPAGRTGTQLQGKSTQAASRAIGSNAQQARIVCGR